MNVSRRAALALTVAGLVGFVAAPSSTLAAPPTFGQPTATAVLGDPIILTSTIAGDDIADVAVLVRLVGDPTNIVLPAAQVDPPGTWQVSEEIDIQSSALCECIFEAPSAPNTRFEFQFRVRGGDGTTTLGPLATAIVEDNRFEWRVLEQDLVRVHWYAGNDAFAQNAADLGNDAIDRASELFGATLPGPVDLFVYDTQEALLEAVSPNRENIAGEAHRGIQTMFVWIPHDQGADAFSGEVVRHELTHLVFFAATDNPYHDPALWISEGVAVYLSVGYSAYYRSFVDGAVADGSLIPLDGLTGFFPAVEENFFLAYAEAVAAVDYFVRTYGEEQLWALVRSYANGMTDDEAFAAATGADMAGFDAAWFESLGVDLPAPLGPQPAPTGPLPPGWQVGSASPVPTFATARPGVTPTPRATAAPADGSAGQTDLTRGLAIVLWLLVGVILVVLVGYLIAQRSRAQR